MLPKITIEEFNRIKEQLKKFLQDVEKRLENPVDEEGYEVIIDPDEYEEIERQAIKEYTEIQNQFLNYDLSDIPFEAWEGVYLIGEEPLDLSRTHANLDFKIVELNSRSTVNLKGCQIRNLDYASMVLDETCFDPEVIRQYPSLFLSEIFPPTFRSNFANKSLTLEELKSLTPEQIEELKDKKIHRVLKDADLRLQRDHRLKTIIELLPLEQFVHLLKQDEEILKDAAAVAQLGYYSIKEDDVVIQLLINEKDIEVIRTKLHEIFNEKIATHRRGTRIELDDFSEEFKLQHQDIFPNMSNYPEELKDKIIQKGLKMDDLLTYASYLQGVDIVPFMEYGNSLSESFLMSTLGKHLTFIVSSFPAVIKNRDEIFADYTVRDTFEDNFRTGIVFAEADGPEAIKDLFMQSVLNRQFGRDNYFEFAKIDSPDIYEDSFYPEWLKETGYYVSKVIRAADTYHSVVGYITPKTIIEDEDLKVVFDTLGYANIKRLEKNNYFFGTRVIRALSETIRRLQIKPVQNYEEFKEKLLYLIFRSNGYEKRELLSSLKYIKKDFYDNRDEYLIPEDAPEDLQKWYYSGEFDIRKVLEHEDWIPYVLKLNFEKIGMTMPIQVYDSSQENMYLTEVNLIGLLLAEKTPAEIIEFFRTYSVYISNNHRYKLDLKDVSEQGIEQAYINAIVSYIVHPNEMGRIIEDGPATIKNQHPELFLAPDAPEELKSMFYGRYLSLDNIRQKPEWIPYLKHVNPELIRNAYFGFSVFVGTADSIEQEEEFGILYVERYGLQAYLEFIIQYPGIERLRPNASVKNTDKETLENSVNKYYAFEIRRRNHPYSETLPQAFKDKNPDLFLAEDAPAELKEVYYSRKLTFSMLRNNPHYRDYIKDVELSCAFGDRFTLWLDDIYADTKKTIPTLLQYLSKDQLLELLTTYGEYIAYLRLKPEFFEVESFEKLKENLEERIITTLKDTANFANYLKYQEDAPAFVKEKLPEYFLAPDAPEELKNYFYQVTSNYQLTFELIGAHKEWHPYLKNKNLIAALAKLNDMSTRDNSIKFIELFGQDNALRLSASRTETVTKMISARKVDVMYEWWLKTGKKFLPDYTIMQLFAIEEADKFLSHGKEWSSLMKNKRFSTTQEGKESMIKLAYSFGVFDGDQQGYKKLDSLLNDIPKKLNQSDMDKLLQTEAYINDPNSQEIKPGIEEYQLLRATLAQEGLEITSNSIFEELYRKNEDGTYTLTINSQEYPKSRELLRTFMEKNNLSMVISAAKAHTLFGAFDLIYDRDFREFLLKNLEVFITTPEYVKYISAIQKQFQLIKTMNSNRVLTPELAVSFVQESKYENIEVGNEELSRVSSVAGYTQAEFDTLQRIYNYGKSRVTSSIPRVEGTMGIYSYEILRLTDPLAVAIGTLTDCCQEIGNAAEVCMEHSMVDQNGRVFVIRDDEGNIVAQSWVWRNKDVLCFDNIEIPDKAFTRALRGETPKTRQEFAKEVYDVYKKAAQDLIAADEKVYKELLERGQITQEQYDGLRLGKVTVGLGYNDIAEALNKYAPLDKEAPARPLEFTPPVELSRGLYTSDSNTQRVIEQREDRKPSIEGLHTLPVHHDEFEIYDITNINHHTITAMNRLEASVGRYSYQMNTQVDLTDNSKAIMEELSYNYGTNAEHTKVIINPNFCIIYEELENEIKIVDVLSSLQLVNQRIETSTKEKVSLQMKIAVLQLLKAGKPFNTSSLSRKELETLTSVMELPEDALNQERGISHGTI